MKVFSIILLVVCNFFVIAQDDYLERLTPEALKNEVLRRELALAGIEDAKDEFSKALLKASVFYYDKKWDSALVAYLPLLDSAPDILYGPLAIRIARCELEMGNILESRKTILNIKSIKNNKNSWESADRILLEGILLDTAIAPKAKKDSIDKRLKSKPSETYAQFLKWKFGGTNNYFALLKSGGIYADSAFYALQRLSPNSVDYDYIRYLCRKGKNEQCVEKITLVLENKNSKPAKATKTNLMVLRAEAWKRMDKLDLAIGQYKELLDSVEYNSTWLQSLLRMVRTAENKKEEKRLDSIFQKKYPFSAENANNLWVKALNYEQAKNYKQAIETYKKLYNSKFGKNQRRQWAKFRVGFINFKEKKYEVAAEIFFSSAKDNLGLMPRSASLYFYAESKRLQENIAQDSLTSFYIDVIEDFPLGYYSWRAKQRLKEFNLMDSIPKIGKEMTNDSAIIWLRDLQKKALTEKDSLVSVERLEQVSVLLSSGFEREAFSLYEEALKFHKNRPEFYYRYGLMFIQNGEYALAHRMARNFLDMVPRQKMSEVPTQVLKFLYPLPHSEKVKRHTQINPFLVYSVMRQESMFDAQITSPAGARGLLQIMPATGANLAALEKIDKFDKDLLYNAYMNIRLGVRYLNDLYNQYNGDYIGVLGNYNAGPAPAARWLSTYSSEPWDIRVEEVSYWETRDYVKRVMGNYWMYKELYE